MFTKAIDLNLCRRSRDGFLSERRCRCQAFWLSISHRRSSDSSWTDDVRTNSNADSSTNVVSWRRRQRCPVARVSKLTSDGMWTTQHAYEQCSSTNCFACCRRELLWSTCICLGST